MERVHSFNPGARTGPKTVTSCYLTFEQLPSLKLSDLQLPAPKSALNTYPRLYHLTAPEAFALSG